MYDIVCFFSILAVGLTFFLYGFLLLLFLANEMLTLFCIPYVHQKNTHYEQYTHHKGEQVIELSFTLLGVTERIAS